MTWVVELADEFEAEFLLLAPAVQDGLLAMTKILRDHGPLLGRPHADTLKGSQFVNMKELRLEAADGVWRVAFAFDPARQAILLVAGDRSGVGETRFYRQLTAQADTRFAAHLKRLGR